jgi:hypothetical protein
MKMHLIADSMGTFEFLRAHLSSLPQLVRFVVGMSPESRHRCWAVGCLNYPRPYALDLIGKERPANFHGGSGFRTYEAMEVALNLTHSDGFRNRNQPIDSARKAVEDQKAKQQAIANANDQNLKGNQL